MREIQVPGGEPPNNRPAQRWAVEMDEDDACRELAESYSGSPEDILDFIRGDHRPMITAVAQQALAKFNPNQEQA
jgi:hypothetical protein